MFVRIISVLFLLAVAGLIVGIGAGLLGFIHPAFDTIASFRYHFALGLGGLALLALLFSRFKTAITAAIFALAGYLLTHDRINGFSYPVQSIQPEHEQYSILHLNLYFRNTHHEKVLELIADTRPDLISLNEITKIWIEKLGKFDAEYPYKFYCPEWGVHIGGSIILSKFEILGDNRFCQDYAALALADIMIDGKKLTVGTAHMRWPWPASGPIQLDELKPVLESLGPDALIAGDFNSVTWSHQMKRLAGYGRLDLVGGLGSTWMHQLAPISWAGLLGLPIDHVLSKGAVQITSANVLGDVGSDHLPLLVRFEFR